MPITEVDYAAWLTSLDEATFSEVADAAETVLTLHEALANDGLTLLGELFRDRGDTPIEIWAHYPEGDCIDPTSGAMFYYHAHDPQQWERNEHGHFHLFVRPAPEADFSHLIAIGMTPLGVPNGLFTTNGWVTDETLRPAGEVVEMLERRWEIARARPSWMVVQWLTSTLRLLHPHVEALLHDRDRRLGWDPGSSPSKAILDDRERHILSEMPLDFMTTLQSVQGEVNARWG